MGLRALAWRALPFENVPQLWAQGDCVFSADGQSATLAVYSQSYRLTTLPWPWGGGSTADHREVLDVFTLDVASRTVRRIASRTTDRRRFRSQATPRFEHRDGAVYYAVLGGHGPYGSLRRIPEGDVPRRRLLVRVDTWGPFRQIGGRHVRSLRAPDSGQTIDDTVLLFVHEDPTQRDRPADPVEVCRIDAWPAHRR